MKMVGCLQVQARVQIWIAHVLVRVETKIGCQGGAAERDTVASMEVGRGYGSLQVGRWLTTNICRSGSLMALAQAWYRCVEEDGGGCYVSPARRMEIMKIRVRVSFKD